MSSFAATRPEADAADPVPLRVEIFRDPEAKQWVAVCDAIPIATEADTVDALIERVWLVAPEVAELNGLQGRLRLQFVIETRAADLHDVGS